MSEAGRDIAVIVPTHGRLDLTSALVADCQREPTVADVIIVDNKRDHQALSRQVRVVSPSEPLGWLRSCNLGIEVASTQRYRAYVLLNNDTRLSQQFFEGLLVASADTGAALIGPMYDDYWPTQIGPFVGRALDYGAVRAHRDAPLVDGTCMFIDAGLYSEIGGLDDRFHKCGYGADYDYAIRTRQAGRRICITEMSYLNHLRHGTASAVLPAEWQAEATTIQNEVFESKWGARLCETRPEDKDVVLREVARLGAATETRS